MDQSYNSGKCVWSVGVIGDKISETCLVGHVFKGNIFNIIWSVARIVIVAGFMSDLIGH